MLYCIGNFDFLIKKALFVAKWRTVVLIYKFDDLKFSLVLRWNNPKCCQQVCKITFRGNDSVCT